MPPGPDDEGKVVPVYIGVDPGANGGLACIALDGIEAVAMPKDLKGVWTMISWFEPGMNPVAVVELVTGYAPGASGERFDTGSSMFKFGQGYGSVLMALTAAGIPYKLAHPAKWQRDLGISPRRTAKSPHGKESKSEFKRRLLHFSQKLYPDVKVSLKVCDALLLAHYCKMLHERKPSATH